MSWISRYTPPWIWWLWPGRGRGICRWLWFFYAAYPWIYLPPYTSVREKEILEYEKASLERELKIVEERLRELEKTKK
jgi:hypothetical protein